MRVDIHVHVAATTPGRGSMSKKLLSTIPFRYLQWKMGFSGASPDADRLLLEDLLRNVNEAVELDAVVLLAFDAAYTTAGKRDESNTHLFVENDYVARIARENSKVLFGASVNPYRDDALDELDRCVAQGAVLMKWLPMVQGFDPAHARCMKFYDALVRHKLPLLSHTGDENSLPVADFALADPRLLVPALERGVTVIAAHCGSRLFPARPNYVPVFLELCARFPNLYGDTAALNQPGRWNAYLALQTDPRCRGRLLHGSDWPILSLPWPAKMGLRASLRSLREKNALRRDVLLKRGIGFDEEYFTRASRILRLPPR